MDEPPDDRRRTSFLILGAAILLVALTVFLLIRLRHGIKMQDCFAQGRHDCAPVDSSGQ